MSNSVSELTIQKHHLIKYISFIIIFMGISVRLFHYFANRSLWMDEIYLTSSLLKMNYMELATQTLDYQQKAPLFFVWSTKFFITTFGNNEMSLRTFPLVCGIFSIILFARVCSAYLTDWAKMIALAIFSFSPAIVYHSVEIKQYATECLGTIVSIYLFVLFKDSQSAKKQVLWGILGGVVIWFSFSALFILAAIGLAVSVQALLARNCERLKYSFVAFGLWFASFLLNYFFYIQKQAQSDWVVYWFKVYDNFLPLPPKSIQELKWFARNFIDVFDYPLGLIWFPNSISKDILTKFTLFPFIPVVLLVLGMTHMKIKQKQLFHMSVTALMLTLLASGFNMYPLIERFWVFLAPIFILTIGFGFDHLISKTKSSKQIYAVSLLLLVGPLFQTTYYLLNSEQFYKHKKSFQKEMLNFINQNSHEGDFVYNYWNNDPGVKIYTSLYNYRFGVIYGKDFRKISRNLNEYNELLNEDFQKIKDKKRVWLIYNTQFLTDIGDMIDEPSWYYSDRYSPIRNLTHEFSKLGKPVLKKEFNDVTCLLFYLHRNR